MATFTGLIKALMDQQTDPFDIVVLKGFSNKILKEVSATFPHVMGKLPLDARGLLDLEKIQKDQDALFGQLTKA